MQQRITKVLQSIDRLSLRERLFLLAASLTVLTGLWEVVLAGPLDARERIATDKITSLEQQLKQLNESIELAAVGMSEGMPDQMDRIRALRARVEEGEQSVRIYTSDLIDPAQMRLVLEELIRRQDRLELLHASNLDVRPLFDEPEATPGEPVVRNADEPKLYRHTLVLTLRGRYLDVLDYLETVERLPWNLYWSRLQFAADEYPFNTVMIELHTLSLEEEWIGV
jgi:MSHA biogenesis protein MshJ